MMRLTIQIYFYALTFCLTLVIAGLALGTALRSDVIAFTSDRDGDSDIYVMDMDRGLVTAVTRNDLRDDYPAWSPDGNQLAYNTWFSAQNSEIFITDAMGRNARRLTQYAGDDRFPTWSPDGSQIIFSSYRAGSFRIFTMDIDGTNLRRLPDNQLFQAYMACWSPDGTQIVFTDRSDIFVMDGDGTNIRRLTDTDEVDSQPQWSRDGREIIFASERSNLGVFNIFVMATDGSDVQRLTSGLEHNQQPQFSPDSRYVVFASGRESSIYLYIMNADGSSVRLLDTGGTAWSPAWMP